MRTYLPLALLIIADALVVFDSTIYYGIALQLGIVAYCLRGVYADQKRTMQRRIDWMKVHGATLKKLNERGKRDSKLYGRP